MSNGEIIPRCLKGGDCEAACGKPLEACPPGTRLELYSRSAALPLAEHLCLSGLEASRERRNSDPLKQAYTDICADLDRALALPNLTGEISNYKHQIVGQIARQLHEAEDIDDFHQNGRLAYHFRLEQIGQFMPLFLERIKGREPGPDTVATVHANICSWLDGFDERYLRPQPKDAHWDRKQIAGFRSEMEIAGLLTRLGMTAYPALKREEANQINARHNHDLYLVDNGQKIPIQCKTSMKSSGYDLGKILVVRYYDILRSMKQAPVEETISWQPDKQHEDYEWPNPYTYRQILSGRKPAPIGQLLIDELKQGKDMDPVELNTLNLASAYLTSRISEFKSA